MEEESTSIFHPLLPLLLLPLQSLTLHSPTVPVRMGVEVPSISQLNLSLLTQHSHLPFSTSPLSHSIPVSVNLYLLLPVQNRMKSVVRVGVE